MNNKSAFIYLKFQKAGILIWISLISRRVDSIKAERAPQILTIQHKNEEEETDCFEDEFPAFMDENSGEESEENKESDTEETSSPDSCFDFRSLGACFCCSWKQEADVYLVHKTR